MNITVKKASTLSGLFLSYEFERTDGEFKDTIKTKSDAAIHEDLRKAFRSFIPHMLFICEERLDEKLIRKIIDRPEDYLEDRETSKDETLLNYSITDVAINHKKGVDHIVITATKSLVNLNYLTITAPSIILDDRYAFYDDLNQAVDTFKREVIAYMEGKHAPSVQFEMFGDNDPEEHFGDDTETHKRAS